jgi:hypothetical protein
MQADRIALNPFYALCNFERSLNDLAVALKSIHGREDVEAAWMKVDRDAARLHTAMARFEPKLLMAMIEESLIDRGIYDLGSEELINRSPERERARQNDLP